VDDSRNEVYSRFLNFTHSHSFIFGGCLASRISSCGMNRSIAGPNDAKTIVRVRESDNNARVMSQSMCHNSIHVSR